MRHQKTAHFAQKNLSMAILRRNTGDLPGPSLVH